MVDFNQDSSDALTREARTKEVQQFVGSLVILFADGEERTHGYLDSVDDGYVTVQCNPFLLALDVERITLPNDDKPRNFFTAIPRMVNGKCLLRREEMTLEISPQPPW